MSKLLTEQELKKKLEDVISGFAFAKLRDLPSAIEDAYQLIQSQKQAHADMVIGDDEPEVDKKAKSPYVGAVARLHRNYLRAEQRERNR